MPARNEACPCGSGAKYKRCCQIELDGVTRELRERDALLGELTDWIRSKHADTLEAAADETTLIRLLRGQAGRSACTVWAINDYQPDGLTPLMARFATRPDLSPVGRAIALDLSKARLDVYRVESVLAGLWVQVKPIAGGSGVVLAERDGLDRLTAGEILVARVVTANTLATTWGGCFRFESDTERRWAARLAGLPPDRAGAALAVLGFHPDDAAEPVPDALDVRTVTWPIADDEDVLEAIEESDAWECIGEAIPSGWAFSWLDDQSSSVQDLGGWLADDDIIETARLIVLDKELRLVSTDRDTLDIAARRVETDLHGLIGSVVGKLAA